MGYHCEQVLTGAKMWGQRFPVCKSCDQVRAEEVKFPANACFHHKKMCNINTANQECNRRKC